MQNEFSLGKWLSENNFHLLPLETRLLAEGYEAFTEDEKLSLIEHVAKDFNVLTSEVDDSTLLAFCKKLKIKRLKKECTSAIHKGFISTVGNGTEYYDFGLNEHDQGNFNSQINKMNLRMGLLSRGRITQEEYDATSNVTWKTKNMGVVQLNEFEFIQVTDDAEYHVRSMQTKYWILENQILGAESCDQLKLIKWEEGEI